MPPRTIDNLGVDVSTRYAEDQKTLDTKLIKEARSVQGQAIVDVTTPAFSSELDALLQSEHVQVPWALFTAPLGYNEQKRRLFTFQVIPSLGSEDRQESKAQKILAKLKTLSEKKLKRREEGEEEKEKEREAEQENEYDEMEREKKILISLLDTISQLDKLMVDINSRRSQYQKG